MPSIVNIGISPDHPSVPEDFRDKLHTAIADSHTQMKDAGYDFVSLAIDPDNKVEALRSLTNALTEEQRVALVIGGGLRKMPQMIPILEDIINTSKDVSPKTKILFTDWPTGILDSLKRL